MDQLARDYASKPVLFLEQDVDRSLGSRQDRWWAAFSGSNATLPLMMADSGHRISSGSVSFYSTYKSMVDAELARAPGAEFECTSARVGNRLQVSGWITNRSGVTLSFARNGATIHALVYEDVQGTSTGRTVRAAVAAPMSADLPNGSAASFTLATSDLDGVNWDKLHSVVMADYRPAGSSGPYDMLQASVPYTAAADASTTALFAQVAIGGGYTTVFSFVNTGSTAVSGQLILTDRNGNPWTASFSEPAEAASVSAGRPIAIAPFTSISIPPGGTQYIAASAGTGGDVMTGWARVESSGGTVGGVATYQYAPAGNAQTIVGVLSGPPVASATIPRDDDVSKGRYTGFAVANPGSETITIQVLEVTADAAAVTSLTPIALAPRSQKAAFFFEDPKAAQTFRGAMVLVGQSGATFAVVSLVQNNGIYSAIPAVPGHAPNVIK